jgi:hypothetical protein
MVLSIAAVVIALASAAAAIYAVVIGRQSLAWQKQQDVARVTPSVRIEIGHKADPEPQYVHGASRRIPLEYRLTISVVNTGETIEHLKRLRIEAADHSQGRDLKGEGADDSRFACPQPIGAQCSPDGSNGRGTRGALLS